MSSASVSDETESLLRQIEHGDGAAIDRLLRLYRPYLKRVVELRLDPELRRRLEPSDVVQETQIVAARRIHDFLKRRPTSFRLWLRRKAIEQMVDLRRRHLGAQKRSVRVEIGLSQASSLAFLRHLASSSPSRAAQRKEQAEQVRQAIEHLSDLDREILLLRHVEELSNAEVAELLKIEPAAASKRYGRAVRRLCIQLGDGKAF